MTAIRSVATRDARFDLPAGAGSDSVHGEPQYAYIALGLPLAFLEHIPHLADRFVHPARVTGGVYRTPQEPGASSDLVE